MPSNLTVEVILRLADYRAPLRPLGRNARPQFSTAHGLDLAGASDRHGSIGLEMRSPLCPDSARPTPDRRHGEPAPVPRRRALAGLLAGATLAGISQPLHAREIEYRSFDGPAVLLQAHIGRRVALLVPQASWDHRTLARWVDALDRAWDAYRLLTATQPRIRTGYAVDGRATFAVVPATCGGRGAGCGFLAQTGIEINHTTFRLAHDQLRDNGLFDQTLFYEIGRNFWTFGEQLGPLKAMATGFAIANRFLSMRLAEVPGADFLGWEFEHFERAVAEEVLPYWMGQSARSWQRDLAEEQWTAVFKGPNGITLGAADLAAGILLRIRATGGYSGYRAFWERIASMPPSRDAAAARDALVEAGRVAAGLGLGAVFSR
jgi:serralysin